MRRGEAVRGAVLESAIDCVITMNHEGRVVEFNPAAERTFGYRRSDAVGKLVRELIVPADQRDAHQRGLERYLATGEGPLIGTRAEVTAMKADGTEFPVEISITRIGARRPAHVRRLHAGRHRAQGRRGDRPQAGGDRRALQRRDRRPPTCDGTIVRLEPGRGAALRVDGRTRSSAGTSPSRPRRTAQSEANFLARQVADGKAVAGHRTVRMRKDGSLVDVSLTLSPILGSDESVGGHGRDHQGHHGGEAHRGRAHPAAGPGEGGTAARRGARAARIVHRRDAGGAGQLAEVRRGPEAAHPPDRRRCLADWCAVHMLRAPTARSGRWPSATWTPRRCGWPRS